MRPDLSRSVPLWAAAIAAAAGGTVLAGAFPALGWWPLAVLGTAIILWALNGRTLGGSFLVGLAGGGAFYGIHIFWLTTYLGAVPWLALAGLQTIFFALGAMLIGLAWRFGLRSFSGAASRLILLPLVLAGLWVLREAIVSVWPYGGFSWGRLAFSQSESPLAGLAAWLGASGLSFVVALLAAVILQAVREPQLAVWPRLLTPAVAVIAAFAMPAWPTPAVGDTGTASIRVAAVQGNSDAGLFAQRERGDILDDHLQATVPILHEDVDLVVWPENAADLNPLDYPQAAGVLNYVTEQLNAPLVVGTITSDEVGRLYNSLLLWQPGDGAVAQYDKIHPVPFAEYLPDRDFWYPFAPSLFDLVPRDYSFGQRPNVFDIALANGDSSNQDSANQDGANQDSANQDSVQAGLAICFDIVDDSLLRQMMDGGAEIILAPTNNADFGHSQESIQQLAIARLRAVEYGRTVVNTSTVGTSAIIAPDGSTIAQLESFTAGTMVENVPLSTAATPASVIGQWVEWLAAIIGLGGLIGLAVARFLRSSRQRMPRG